MIEPIWTNNWACNHYSSWLKHLGKFTGKEAHALEIGVCEGRSTCFFTQNILTHQDSTMTCVDPFLMSTEERFWHNVDALNCRSKITLFKAKSDDVSLEAKKWDFVYIDGHHGARFALFDAVRSWNALKKGGIMIWDDYQWRMNELSRLDCPKMGIDMFLNICERELRILHLNYQVIVEKTA
jgi:predicted O-methyltransferase YrrM